jgi:diguanylate cyclase (GGDEF)-like protein
MTERTESVEIDEIDEIEEEWSVARERARRTTLLSAGASIGLAVTVVVMALVIAQQLSSTAMSYVWGLCATLALAVPSTILMSRRVASDQATSNEVVGTMALQLNEAIESARSEAVRLEVLVRRQTFESRLANALEMAEGEPEVIDVIERSLSATLPESAVELLLADNSHAHLLRMATASPTGEPPGCCVDSPDHCPAARRAQVQVFSNSEALDACPKLRDRTAGSISALCVPVSIMGRTVGVIHAVGDADADLAQDAIEDLEILAKLAGARIGLLRVIAETELQASTDNLTGLLNRRTFEQQLSASRAGETTISIAMIDLDHFKTLNDTYGHETGDRSLRLFSQVLRECVRAHDLVCRYGGEEFVIALPGCAPERVGQILDAMSMRLEAATTVAGLPAFTVSCGVVEVGGNEDLVAAVGRADEALFEAKRAGRNCVVIHDAKGTRLEATDDHAHHVRSDARELFSHDDA